MLIPQLTRLKTSVFVLLLTSIICSCTTAIPLSQAELPKLPLLAPNDFPERQQFNQVFTITSHHRQSSIEPQSLLAVWATPTDKLIFSALTATGQPLMSATLVEKTLDSKTIDSLPEFISAATVISQIQLAYWPAAAIQKAIKNSQWKFTEKDHRRTLSFNRQTVIEITHINQKQVKLIHHLFGFSVEISTLKKESL
jgi:Protein of unknown function (DUF3261)